MHASLAPPSRPPDAAARRVHVAMGVLTTPSDRFHRRAKLRALSRSFANVAGGSFALRFVIGAPAPVPQSLAAEASQTSDLVLLNMSETPFRCALKYLLWFSFALQEFPSVQWLGAGDDDAYIQFEHMEADLRHVGAQTNGGPSLWGLIMWRPFYNKITMDTTTGFTVRSCTPPEAPLHIQRSTQAFRTLCYIWMRTFSLGFVGLARRRQCCCGDPEEDRRVRCTNP